MTRPSGYEQEPRERERPRPSADERPATPEQRLLSGAGNRAIAAMVQRWRAEPEADVTRASHRTLQRWPAELPIADGGRQQFQGMADVFRYFASVPPDKAKSAAEALLQVLMPFNRTFPPYGAKDDPEEQRAKLVQQQLGITFGEWNGLIFEARSRLEQSDRLKAQGPSAGPQPTGPLRNPTEVQDVKDFVTRAGPKFSLLYDDAELDGLVDFAKSLGLPSDEFHGIVQTGCREVKPRSAEQLKDQMYNWKSVVGTHGRPFKFQDAQRWNLFKASLQSKVSQCVLPGGIPLPAGDIRIQGSSLRTPFADDVDIAVCVTREQYRNICAGRFQEHFFKTGQPQGKEQPLKLAELQQISYDDLVAMAQKGAKKTPDCGFMTGGQKGRKLVSACNYILMGKFDGKSEEFMKPLYDLTEAMKTEFQELNIESVTVILRDGPFDLKPALAL